MIKFALVGCGKIAKKYGELLGEGRVKGACLSAVCDLDSARAESFAQKFSVAHYSDMHQMMENERNNIDVVAILTQSGLHAKHCNALAPYGKHIVVEKPMALTLEDADEMIRSCDEHNVTLFVVKQNRYNLPVQKLKQALDAGRFGKIVMGTVRMRWCRDQAYYDRDPWRGTWGMDGGVFTNQASHHIDLLEWMLGAPVSVFAKSSTTLVDIEAENTGVAVVQFKSGAIGVIEATTATRPTDLEGSLSVLGEKGTVEVGGFAADEMKVWNFVDSVPEDVEAFGTFKQNPADFFAFGHARYLEQVVDAIENNRSALVDGLEGRKSLELITALYESIETGQEVSLRFKPNRCRLGVVNG